MLNQTLGLTGVFNVTPGTVRNQFNKLKSFKGMFWVTIGAMNTTAFLYGQNRTDCQLGSQDIIAAFEAGQEQLKNGTGYFNYLQYIDRILQVPYLSNTIVYSCYYGVEEYDNLSSKYWSALKDIETLKFNLWYNSGDLLHSTKNLFLYFFASKYTRVQDTKQFGMEIGNMLWQSFYPQKENILAAIEAGTWEFPQDYTWDDVIK